MTPSHGFCHSTMLFRIIWASFFVCLLSSLWIYISPDLHEIGISHQCIPPHHNLHGIQFITVEWMCGLSCFWIIIMILYSCEAVNVQKVLCSQSGKESTWLKSLKHQKKGLLVGGFLSREDKLRKELRLLTKLLWTPTCPFEVQSHS